MEKQIMKYSKEMTETHQLSCLHQDCLQLISDCFTQEGGKGNLFCQNETCINLDRIEKKQHKSSPQATMDITIGIEVSSKKMLLVEMSKTRLAATSTDYSLVKRLLVSS